MMDKEKKLLVKLSTIIRARRHELNLSQLEVAERADCGLNAIGRLERVQVDPTFTTLIKIADALEMSPKDLFPN